MANLLCCRRPKAGGASKATPLPMRAIAMVIFVQFSEAFQITVLFPFVPFMVAEFAEVDEAHVGLYSGLVAAAFPFGQLCTSVLWGKTADRFGAKRVVLFSLVLTCACTLVFGFSTTLVMAILSRLAAGLCNGNIGVIKSYLGKVTDATNQGHAMALLSAAWALGSIIAPALGGFLAQPAEQYPGLVKPGSLLDRYHYLLPCLVAASCLVISIFLVALFMKEANEVLKEIAERRERLAQDDAESERVGVINQLSSGWARLQSWAAVQWARRPGAPSSSHGRMARLAQEDDDDGEQGNFHDVPGHDRHRGDAQSIHSTNNEDDHEHHASMLERTNQIGAEAPSTMDAGSPAANAVESDVEQDDSELMEVGLQDETARLKPAGRDARATMLERVGGSVASLNPDGSVTLEPLVYQPPRLRSVLFATMMYGSVAFFYSYLDDTFPLFCRDTYENGGLQFTTNDIGIALSFLGGVSICYNIFLFPYVSRKLGLMRLYRMSLLAAIPMCLMFPIINVVGSTYGSQAIWPLLLGNMLIRGVVGLQMFTTVMVYVNNSVPRERMGWANGIGQSFAAGVRAFGPTLAGLLWSLLSRARFPGHQFIIFVIACCMLIAQYLLSFRYPESIQRPFVKVPIDDPEMTATAGKAMEMKALASAESSSIALPLAADGSDHGSGRLRAMLSSPSTPGNSSPGSGSHTSDHAEDDMEQIEL